MPRLTIDQVAAPNLSGVSAIQANAGKALNDSFTVASNVLDKYRENREKTNDADVFNEIAKFSDDASLVEYLSSDALKGKELSGDMREAILGLRQRFANVENTQSGTTLNEAKTRTENVNTDFKREQVTGQQLQNVGQDIRNVGFGIANTNARNTGNNILKQGRNLDLTGDQKQFDLDKNRKDYKDSTGILSFGGNTNPSLPNTPTNVNPQVLETIYGEQNVERVSDTDNTVQGFKFARYDTKGTRRLPVKAKIVHAMGFLEDMGLTMEIYSGGQKSEEEGGIQGKDRTGKKNHDHGNAADIRIIRNDNGKQLKVSNPKDRELLKQVMSQARANGITSMGIGDPNDGGYYQGDGNLHIGLGAVRVWGADGDGKKAPSWAKEAFYAGEKLTPNYGKNYSTIGGNNDQPEYGAAQQAAITGNSNGLNFNVGVANNASLGVLKETFNVINSANTANKSGSELANTTLEKQIVNNGINGYVNSGFASKDEYVNHLITEQNVPAHMANLISEGIDKLNDSVVKVAQGVDPNAPVPEKIVNLNKAYDDALFRLQSENKTNFYNHTKVAEGFEKQKEADVSKTYGEMVLRELNIDDDNIKDYFNSPLTGGINGSATKLNTIINNTADNPELKVSRAEVAAALTNIFNSGITLTDTTGARFNDEKLQNELNAYFSPKARSAANVQRLTNEALTAKLTQQKARSNDLHAKYNKLVKQGKGNSPEAARINKQLDEALDELNEIIIESETTESAYEKREREEKQKRLDILKNTTDTLGITNNRRLG